MLEKTQSVRENRALSEKLELMIRYTSSSDRKLSLFETLFENHLEPECWWVKMSEFLRDSFVF